MLHIIMWCGSEMVETFIFDIPIYRVAEAKYYADQKIYIESRLYEHPELNQSEMEAFYKKNPDRKTSDSDYYWRQYGGPWRFNDIVGYIRLYFESYQGKRIITCDNRVEAIT